jgi:hypothetical protein
MQPVRAPKESVWSIVDLLQSKSRHYRKPFEIKFVTVEGLGFKEKPRDE